MAIASAVALPWILIRLPEDYFVATQQHKPDRSPLGWLIWLLRNSLAIVLLIVGLLMLVLPGQGLLMILIALGVSTSRHKYSLDRKSTRLNSSHVRISYAVFCLKKKKTPILTLLPCATVR